LVLIGGETALNILDGYASDQRQTVVNEILKGWDYFDREEYAKRIINKRRHLRWDVPSSLDGFQYLTNLESLSLYDSWQLKDLTPLAALKDLKSLTSYSLHNVTDLNPLGNLLNLREINLSGISGNDINVFSKLVHLINLLRDKATTKDKLRV
jgi:hypothetical protein